MKQRIRDLWYHLNNKSTLMEKLVILTVIGLVLYLISTAAFAQTTTTYRITQPQPQTPTQWVTDSQGRTVARIDSQGWITSTTGPRAGQTIGRIRP